MPPGSSSASSHAGTTGKGSNGPSESEFEQECRAALTRLRASLIGALGEAGIDVSHPRGAARQLGLDKTLVWRLSRMVGQSDVLAAATDVPGKQGRELIVGALAEAGSSEPTLSRLRAALRQYDDLVRRHAGDRATFELVASSLGPARGPSQEQARKLAFRGNSGVWSVQVETQLNLGILAPNADDPDMVDVAQVSGFVKLRRLHPDVRWPMTRSRTWESGRTSTDMGEPLDIVTDEGVPVLRRFSSDPLPPLLVEDDGESREVLLAEGPVGRTGEVTIVYGSVIRALGSQYATEPGDVSQLGVTVLTPAERLHFDLFVHRDLDWAMDPRPAVYSSLQGRHVHVESGREDQRLPVTETVVPLGRGTAGSVSSRMPWYPELVTACFERLGWDADAFGGFRFELAYPPMPSHVLLYSPLRPPRAPGRSPSAEDRS